MRTIAKNVSGMVHLVNARMKNILKIHIMLHACGSIANTGRRRDEG